MAYRLRYQQHDFELTEGQFTIGRSTSCQLSLDDPLVSRTHARLTVSGDAVVLEDLGSRNGVQVNGQRVDGQRTLLHGDRIGVGGQEMLLLKRREVSADTVAQAAPARPAQSFGLIAILAEKALTLGRPDEAERLLAPQLGTVLSDLAAGQTSGTETLDRAAEFAAKLAAATGKGSWVDYIVSLYATLEQPMPAVLVDQLYTIMRRVKQIDLRALRAYVDTLRGKSGAFGPRERFLVSRIEGLERLAASK